MKKTNYLDKLVFNLEKRLMDYRNYESVKEGQNYKKDYANLYIIRKYQDGKKVLLFFHIEKNNGWVEEERAKTQIRKKTDAFRQEVQSFTGYHKIYWFYVLGFKDKICKIKRNAIMERIE